MTIPDLGASMQLRVAVHQTGDPRVEVALLQADWRPAPRDLTAAIRFVHQAATSLPWSLFDLEGS